MICDDKAFFEWYQKATEEEIHLCEKVEQFGKYFSDMLFADGITKSFVTIQKKLKEDDEYINSTMTLPKELEDFSYSFFTYRIEESEEYEGLFDRERQCLTVVPNCSDSTVLHEMIHLHEFVLNELQLFFHDVVIWSLYRDLVKKIPRLDKIIENLCHIYNDESIYCYGGLHDLLFTLKSFDLDLRMGYELGTVFGYGKLDEIKRIQSDMPL